MSKTPGQVAYEDWRHGMNEAGCDVQGQVAKEIDRLTARVAELEGMLADLATEFPQEVRQQPDLDKLAHDTIAIVIDCVRQGWCGIAEAAIKTALRQAAGQLNETDKLVEEIFGNGK